MIIRRRKPTPTAVPRKNPVWQDAIRAAKYDYEHSHRVDLPYVEIGRRMGELLERKAFSRQAVGLWFNGTRPEPQNFIALARVLEIEEKRIPALLAALATSPPPAGKPWTVEDSERHEAAIKRAAKRRDNNKEA